MADEPFTSEDVCPIGPHPKGFDDVVDKLVAAGTRREVAHEAAHNLVKQDYSHVYAYLKGLADG